MGDFRFVVGNNISLGHLVPESTEAIENRNMSSRSKLL